MNSTAIQNHCSGGETFFERRHFGPIWRVESHLQNGLFIRKARVEVHCFSLLSFFFFKFHKFFMLHEQECCIFSANGVMFLDFGEPWHPTCASWDLHGAESRRPPGKTPRREHALFSTQSGHILHTFLRGKDLIHYHVLPKRLLLVR